MDVETAFLNGKIKSEIYIQEPEGYKSNIKKACKLKKALYGLRESPIAWYNTFNIFVKKLGFIRSKFDSCLFVKKIGKDSIYLLIFVDDSIICSNNKNYINNVKKDLMSKFTMKDLGKIKTYVGIEINYDKVNG